MGGERSNGCSLAQVVGMLAARDYLQHDRVIARLAHGRKLVTVRAKHLGNVELNARRGDGGASLVVHHDNGWSEFNDGAAIHATGVLLSGANRFGGSNASVQDAVQHIEDAGDAHGFLAEASTRNGWRGVSTSRTVSCGLSACTVPIPVSTAHARARQAWPSRRASSDVIH